jgi:hypothetical protein
VATASDVIIAWGHGPVPDAAKGAFQRPTQFLTLSNPNWRDPLSGLYPPVKTIIQKYAPGVRPLRVACLGFSASGQGVAALLGADGGHLDAAIVVDGMHTGNPVTEAAMTPWILYGKRAVVNVGLLVVTHSSVVPPGYASTTMTADFLWKYLTGSDAAFVNPPLPDLSISPTSVHVSAGPATGKERTIDYPSAPWQPFKRAGGLVILGCDNLDGPGTADHIYQAKAVLPLVLTKLLAERWNAIDPQDAGAACYVG